jgi:alpha-mannosidase
MHRLTVNTDPSGLAVRSRSSGDFNKILSLGVVLWASAWQGFELKPRPGGEMLWRKYRSNRILLAILVLPLLAKGLAGQQPAAQGTPPKREFYVIPFSHFDLFWAGTREECLARGNRIIAKAIHIAKQHPEFRFLLESENFVANYVDTHPHSEELEDLKQLVKQGRFAIAPNWANIFHNLPSGEVHARNLLYGKGYARDVFGVNPRVFNPTDIPGFTPQFPQMLNKADVPEMVMSRMGPIDNPLFRWQAPNGSDELVWSVRGYGLGAHLQLHGDLTEEGIDAIKKELDQRYSGTSGPIFIHWGIDLWAPTEKLVENVSKLNRSLTSAHFVLGTPQDFFSHAVSANTAKLSGEVPMAWPHVVDGILHLWQLAIPATNTLAAAEEFAAINYALGYALYPQEELDFLWKRLIESMDHNHDGQGGEIGDDRKMEYSQLAIIHGGEILRDMLRNIAERVQIPIAKSFPIVVFNGLGWQRDDLVRAHVTLYGDVIPSAISEYKKGLRLVDEMGKPVPFYVEQTSENISRAVDLTFVAQAVPPLGYKTYFLTAAEQPGSPSGTSQVTLDRENDVKEPRRPAGADVIENRFYRLTVDKATGGVTLFDKQLNRDVCKNMQIVGVEERGSNNVQPEQDTGRTLPTSINGTAVEQNNAVRTVFAISGWIADIPIVQRLILYSDLKRIDVENSLDWREQRLVRIEQLFPIQQSHAEMYYGVPFGANSSKNILPGSGPSANDEINKEAWEKYRTIQDWVFAGTSEWGVTLAADHQLIKLDDGLIHANMIRGQRYTSVRIVRREEVSSIHFPPSGHYVFKYSLSSGPGDWKTLRSYQAGQDFNRPLIPVSVVDDISRKSLPPTLSFCSVQADNLVISALKKSQADGSIILRLYEIQGAKAESPVTFGGKQQDFREVDLLEQDLKAPAQRVLRVSPYEIETLRLSPPS